jgi:hypothetical protein
MQHISQFYIYLSHYHNMFESVDHHQVVCKCSRMLIISFLIIQIVNWITATKECVC